jgi:hypothetical protein
MKRIGPPRLVANILIEPAGAGQAKFAALANKKGRDAVTVWSGIPISTPYTSKKTKRESSVYIYDSKGIEMPSSTIGARGVGKRISSRLS